MLAKEANRKSLKLFPLVKMGFKHGGVPTHHIDPVACILSSSAS